MIPTMETNMSTSIEPKFQPSTSGGSQKMEKVFELKETEFEKIWTLTFDLPGEKVNKFDERVMNEFETLLGELKSLGKDKKIRLNQNEKVCFVRPAANCLFESAANNFRGQIASFTLTGMGEDGALGVKQLHKVGAYNFYQDEESCAVFGMPGSVKNLGTAQEIKLPQIIRFFYPFF